MMHRYAARMVEQVGSSDGLIPPPPTLTRYKRELALKAEAEGTDGSPRSARSALQTATLIDKPSCIRVKSLQWESAMNPETCASADVRDCPLWCQ